MLRHEEFEEGCAATCNGPYNGKWSKTMVGYGPEANHFVVELTYNYEVTDRLKIIIMKGCLFYQIFLVHLHLIIFQHLLWLFSF